MSSSLRSVSRPGENRLLAKSAPQKMHWPRESDHKRAPDATPIQFCSNWSQNQASMQSGKNCQPSWQDRGLIPRHCNMPSTTHQDRSSILENRTFGGLRVEDNYPGLSSILVLWEFSYSGQTDWQKRPCCLHRGAPPDYHAAFALLHNSVGSRCHLVPLRRNQK